MQPNPALKKLGYSDETRLLIIHTDDIGMCQASVSAYRDLLEFGLISSAAIMAPCSWFPAAAEVCRDNAEADMGVHLTLNCEWDNYRWGPISTRDPASGLMDEEGYFHRRSEDTQAQADPEAVAVELQAQVARALAAGIDATHVDTHMGTVAHPSFVPGYLQVSSANRLPLMFMRMDAAGYEAMGMDAGTAAMAGALVAHLESQGVPLLDRMAAMPLGDPAKRLQDAGQILGDLPAGITHFIVHPCKDTPELRAIAPDWECRVADYELFMSDEMGKLLEREGFQVIGYRALRDVMRES